MRRLLTAASAAALLLLVATGCQTIRPTGPPSTRTPGSAKVDIVSHSLGSMVTRYCVELGSCAGKVDHWMSLAGADNGTAIALLCSAFQASCADMAGQTPTIANLQAAWPQITAQGVEVEVQWSANDGVIVPATSSQNPSPATNVEVNSTLGHLDIPDDPTVLAETIDFFAH